MLLARVSLLLSGFGVAVVAAILHMNTSTAEEPVVYISTQSVEATYVEPKLIRMTATAYCSCRICCGRKARGITKTGTRATHGTLAVDPRVLDLGSEVKIVGMGDFRCEDTGRKIKGNRIDIWMPTHAKAKKFGKRTVVVEVQDD